MIPGTRRPPALGAASVVAGARSKATYAIGFAPVPHLVASCGRAGAGRA
jgi:hypothetical protein